MDTEKTQPSASNEPAAAQQERFERYIPDLHRFLMRFIQRSQDAEDIRQEVFARVSRIRDHELARDPKAYLFGVAFHVVHEFRMRQRRERVTFDSEAVHHVLEHPQELQPDELVDRLHLRQELERALLQLPAGERATLLMVKRDGLSYEEAADRSGLSVHQIERHMTRARARMKALLAEH